MTGPAGVVGRIRELLARLKPPAQRALNTFVLAGGSRSGGRRRTVLTRRHRHTFAQQREQLVGRDEVARRRGHWRGAGRRRAVRLRASAFGVHLGGEDAPLRPAGPQHVAEGPQHFCLADLAQRVRLAQRVVELVAAACDLSPVAARLVEQSLVALAEPLGQSVGVGADLPRALELSTFTSVECG